MKKLARETIPDRVSFLDAQGQECLDQRLRSGKTPHRAVGLGMARCDNYLPVLYAARFERCGDLTWGR